jgi:uncharacterized membrane protein
VAYLHASRPAAGAVLLPVTRRPASRQIGESTAWRHQEIRMHARDKLESTEDEIQFLVALVGSLIPGLLYLALPDGISFGPSWSLIVVEGVLVAPALVSLLVYRRWLPYPMARSLALAQLAAVTVALVGSLVLLVIHLPSPTTKGSELLRSGVLLWALNILVFALWYWETDCGGPLRRAEARSTPAGLDFLFPQQMREDQSPQQTHEYHRRWRPDFVDYVFLAFCFATALSPADTAPLTHRAKLLMMAEAIISLMVLVLVIARSVNII